VGTNEGTSDGGGAALWEQIFNRANLFTALARVEANGGAPGVDGLTVEALRPYLKAHWLEVRAARDAERYRPQPVRRVEIPKPDGGVRLLGIPIVLDRLIQQAIAQVLTPLFDPQFSEHSYGFRPKRSAHQAIEAAQRYLADGYERQEPYETPEQQLKRLKNERVSLDLAIRHTKAEIAEINRNPLMALKLDAAIARARGRDVLAEVAQQTQAMLNEAESELNRLIAKFRDVVEAAGLAE
jgi:hypothetical protein